MNGISATISYENIAHDHFMKTVKKTKRGSRRRPDTLPMFCDYTCPHAAFPPADAVGACRREIAVWCTLAKKFNNKHARCLVRN